MSTSQCSVSEKRLPSSNIIGSLPFDVPVYVPTLCPRPILLPHNTLFTLMQMLPATHTATSDSITSLKHYILAFKRLKLQFPSTLLPSFSSRALFVFYIWTSYITEI